MPNVQISDLAQALLPLVGSTTFFEVEATEGGVVVSRKVAADDLTISVTSLVITGTSTDDPSIGAGTFDGRLLWQNANALQTGVFGFDPAGDNFIWSNDAEGGFHQIAIRDGTVLVETIAAAAGGLLVNNLLTGGGLERVLTLADISVTPALGDLTDVTLTAPATGAVLYKSAGDWLDTPGILIDPLADVKLHQATVEVFRTLTAAAGGAEANNTLTGAGFERVLTASDAFTGIIEGSSTDSPETPGGTWDGVLRFDNANSLQTARVGFDPAGDTFFVQPTVEGGRLILGGRSPGAPGPERESLIFDFDTGGLPAGSTRFFETNGTAEQMRLDTGVSAVTEVANVLNNPASGLAQHGQFRITNSLAQQAGEFGFPATGGLSTTMRVKNYVHGGPLEWVGETAAGVERVLIFTDPDQAGPIIFSFLDNNPATDASIQDSRLTFRNPSAQTIWQIGFLEGTNDFSIKLFQDTGTLRLRGSSAASGDIILAIFDPVADAKLFQAGTEVFRTVAAASGGAQANNTATGAGFERVLTTADIFGGALNDLSDVTLTAPATGAVLYKSAGNWLDTPAITIDPAAAIQLFHAGVGTPKFRTTANGFDLLGDTSTNSDFDMYSLDGVTIRASMRTDAAGLQIASQPNSLGISLRARNGAGVEQIFFSGTGSTGTADMRWTGLQRIITQQQGVTIHGNGTTNVVALWEGSTGTDLFALRGESTRTIWDSVRDSSHLIIRGNNSASATTECALFDPDALVNLRFAGAIVFETHAVGINVRGDGADSANITFEDTVVSDIGQIDISGSLMLIECQVNSNPINLVGRSSGSVVRQLIQADPDDDVALFDVGVEVARTLPAASGGFEANNTLTGAGFERVLTIADRTSAAAYTPTNVVTTRTYDANATSIDELADVLGTLIADLQAINVIQ